MIPRPGVRKVYRCPRDLQVRWTWTVRAAGASGVEVESTISPPRTIPMQVWLAEAKPGDNIQTEFYAPGEEIPQYEVPKRTLKDLLIWELMLVEADPRESSGRRVAALRLLEEWRKRAGKVAPYRRPG